MSWCNRCLTDHDGLCLDDRRRLELTRQLEHAHPHADPCPFCGGRGRGGPYGYVPAHERCGYCKGTGRIAS